MILYLHGKGLLVIEQVLFFNYRLNLKHQGICTVSRLGLADCRIISRSLNIVMEFHWRGTCEDNWLLEEGWIWHSYTKGECLRLEWIAALCDWNRSDLNIKWRFNLLKQAWTLTIWFHNCLPVFADVYIGLFHVFRRAWAHFYILILYALFLFLRDITKTLSDLLLNFLLHRLFKIIMFRVL
jgi:hypothetical protein